MVTAGLREEEASLEVVGGPWPFQIVLPRLHAGDSVLGPLRTSAGPRPMFTARENRWMDKHVTSGISLIRFL